MTNTAPDYTAIEPPDDKPLEAYSTHERRAAILQAIIEVGTPAAINQRELAARYDVHESTVSRDMDRLREFAAESLGADAKLTTQVVFERTVRELQADGEWKAAWDVVMDWNEWLADIGEQHREPRSSSLDVEMRSQNIDVAYEVVRRGEDEPLPTTDDGTVDHEALGFTSGPTEIESEPAGGDEND